MIETGVDVGLDLLDGVVGIGSDDPALGHLLDGQSVGSCFHFDRVLDAVLLLRRQGQRSPEARVLECGLRVGVVADLDLDHLVDVGDVALGLRGALGYGGKQFLGVELHALARGADEAVAGPSRVPGDNGSTGRDVHGNPTLGNVVDRCATSGEVLAFEVDTIAQPQLAHQPHGLTQAREAFLELGPFALEAGRDLVESLTAADAEHDAPRVETSHCRERLSDDRRVVAERRRHHGRADLHALGALTDGRHPGERERRVSTVVAPWLEMIAHRNGIHAVLLCQNCQLYQFARAELLSRCLVSELEFLRHRALPCRLFRLLL
ncbi:hypothetical protein BKP42_68500 [Rhodococcus erythropolis]|nr:hypothetical protein BKP42_68500 [Rhodococcus erythropolis]